MTQVCPPSTVRLWFRGKEAVNWGVTVIGFSVVYFFLMFIVGGGIAALITIPAAFVLFFFVLEGRPIAIKCGNPECGKLVQVNTPWICGFKGCRNDDPEHFPFVHKCGHCGGEPKAYKCHHCGELIFLTDDRQTINFAQSVNADTPVPDPHNEKVTKKKQGIEISELNLHKTKLSAEINAVKSKAKPIKPKSPRERLRNKVEKQTELDDEVAAMKAKIDEQFKDDPIEREKRHRLIDQAAREEL